MGYFIAAGTLALLAGFQILRYRKTRKTEQDRCPTCKGCPVAGVCAKPLKISRKEADDTIIRVTER